MFNHLAFNIAVLQVGEDIVQLFVRCHDVHPELTKHAVSGLGHFSVQDVKRQAVAQRQFAHNRLMRAVPVKVSLMTVPSRSFASSVLNVSSSAYWLT